MRSPSNDTSRDITSLLSPESRTPEMDELVRVLSKVRPQIFIDRTYQRELRSRLIQTTKSKKYIFSLPLWTGILSTAFAALLGVFAFSSILAPHPTDRVEPVLSLGGSMTDTQATLMTVTSPEISQRQATDSLLVSKKIQDPQIAPGHVSETPPPPVATMVSLDVPEMSMRALPPSMGDVPTGGADMIAVSIPVMPLDDTTTIDTEIADMMSEISTIIHPALLTVTIPTYPTQMSIYEKKGTFTQEEVISHTGTSLAIRTLDTIDRAELRRSIIALIVGDSIVGEGKVIYEERSIGTLHTLIPVLSYTLTSGKVIGVDLVSGYE